MADYLYRVINNPNIPTSATKYYEEPTNERENLLNERISEVIKNNEKTDEDEIDFKRKTKTPKKEVKFDTSLKDPQEALSNTGVNMGGGGFLDNLFNYSKH